MNKKGFTLAEVLVTLGILGIMSAIAIPTYMSWLPRHRLQTSVRQIYDDLNLAKMEAVRRNTDVCIVFYPATETYTVFVDMDGSGTLTGGDVTLPSKNNVALEKDVNINNTSFGNDTPGFNNRGMSTNGNGSINLTNPTGSGGVTINIAGNISAF